MSHTPKLRFAHCCQALLCMFAPMLIGCRSETPKAAKSNATPTHEITTTQPDPTADLGRKIFFDASLSGSGKLSCASCHDPSHAYAPANDLPVQMGGVTMNKLSFRATPSLSYVLGRTPDWHQERASAFVERIEEHDNPPFGGFAWDGRFKTLADQAAFPLLSPNEMANSNAAELLTHLRNAKYADEFKQVFGEQSLQDAQQALADAGHALSRFELTDASFHPYTSKFDQALDGKLKLSEQELRGEALFNDPTRGNCSSCHSSAKGADGSHPLFTNFQFEVLGVPRNRELKANHDANFYDLGLCGPLRTDHANTEAYCGMFKTPSLRNVATRKAFFHNGRFRTLREALRFYVRRDTNPEEFYPKGPTGKVQKFEDLPAKYHDNADTIDLPLTKHPGEKPVWSDQDIEDVTSFLQTLTDNDKP